MSITDAIVQVSFLEFFSSSNFHQYVMRLHFLHLLFLTFMFLLQKQLGASDCTLLICGLSDVPLWLFLLTVWGTSSCTSGVSRYS